MDTPPINDVLLNKAMHRERLGYCRFDAGDWAVLGVELTLLRDLVAPGAESLSARTPIHDRLRRAVVVGRLDMSDAVFYGKQECPVRSEVIIRDYEELLASSEGIKRIISAMRRIGPRELMSDTATRFCVELFCRRHAIEADLPPHADGVDCLLFLILHNSMIGGDMRLFRSCCDRIGQAAPSIGGQAAVVPNKDVELLEVIECAAGNGYLVHERNGSSRDPHILHGCDGWKLPSCGQATRTYLRVSFSTSGRVT